MTTLFDVTLRAADLMKNVRRGVATGGNTTTLADSNHPATGDDYYNGGTIWFITGNNASKTAIITDYATATGTFTFATQAGACAAGNSYAALTGAFTREMLVAGLNAAMADMGELLDSSDLTGVSDQVSYTLTSIADDKIVRVETIPSGSTQPAEHYQWRARDGSLRFTGSLPGAGDTIRVWYYTLPSYITLDADTVNGNYDLHRLAWLVVYHACLLRKGQQENLEPAVNDLFKEATERRAEFIMRRPKRSETRSPIYPNWS